MTSRSLSRSGALLLVTKSNWGGAQAYVYTLAEALRAQGTPVAVAAGGEGLLKERLEKASIRFLPLSGLVRDISARKEWEAFQELISLLKRERPQTLHLNSSKAGVLGALAGRFTGVPRIVFTAHGWPHREPRGPLSKAAIWLASWLTIFLCHRVVVVSDRDMQTAPVLFSRRKLVRIHNGVSAFELSSREEARAALAARAPGLEDFSQILLMNAELHPNKGIDYALHALAALAPSHPELALVVQGEGQEQGRLVELARTLHVEARFFLPGFSSDARSLLRAASLYLMPSRKEGLPMALLEAGFASLPVIAARTGGIPEIIEDQETGLLIPTDDSDALTTAIDSLLEEPAQAAALGAALHTHVCAEFSADEMISQTIAQYS